jgi:hypothetical protein
MTYGVTPDFFLLDNLQPVTVRADSDDGGTAVEHAWRSFVSTREAEASGGKYLTSDVNWHLHLDEYPTPPRPGYQVVDAGSVVWTALQVKRNDFDSRWKLICRDLTISEGLNDRITIQVAGHRRGLSGDEAPAWADWRAGILARIQRERIERATEAGTRSDLADVTILLGEPVEFPLDLSAYRVVGTDGQLYQINSVERFDRIDFLPQMFCQELSPFAAP